MIALCAAGRDPADDPQFAGGKTALPEALSLFRMDDGSFSHTLQEDTGNAFATVQAALAYCAIDRLRNEGRSLYDFTE